MIKKITKIKNFGIFNDFAWTSGVDFCHTNVFYGVNGSGKTTLSNVLFLESNQINEDERNSLLENLKNDPDKDAECELIDEQGKKVRDKQNILVFNSHFVSNHVFDGNKAKIKNFRGGIVTQESL